MLCWGRKWYSSLSPVMFESYLNKSILVHPNQFLVRITPHFWNSLSGHTYVIWVAYLSICWHHLVWVFTWAGINMNELLIVLCESKPREKILNCLKKRIEFLYMVPSGYPAKPEIASISQAGEAICASVCNEWWMNFPSWAWRKVADEKWWPHCFAQDPSTCPRPRLPLCGIH